MSTSARNQLFGTVHAIVEGSVTNESQEEMALSVGSEVTALFKASSVILATKKA